MPVEQHSIGHFERMLHLRKVPVLGTLPPAHLSALADVARERFFPRGSALLEDGDPVGSAYYVLEGQVRLSRAGRLLGSATAGCEVGGVRLLARDAEGMGALAESDTLALEVEADALFDLFEDEFPILHHVLREICRQLIAVQKRDPRWPFLPRHVEGPGELDLVERIFHLRQAPPFARSSINALAELSRGVVEVRFDAGTTLWEAGHPADWVVLVVEGAARCTLLRGQQFLAGPGAPLGALEAVAEMPRWYTAVAQEPLRGLQGSIEGLIDLFEDNFEMALEFLSYMARLLLELTDS